MSSMATINIDEHADARPITRESFLAAYVDANPYEKCRVAAREWDELHTLIVWADEIDEDPS